MPTSVDSSPSTSSPVQHTPDAKGMLHIMLRPVVVLFTPRNVGDTRRMFTVAITVCCVALLGRGIVEGIAARHIAILPSAEHPNNNMVFLLAVPFFLGALEYLASYTSRSSSVLFRPVAATGLLAFTCLSNIASLDTTIAGNLFYLLPAVVGAYAWRTPAVMTITAISVVCCAIQSVLLLPRAEAAEWVMLMSAMCFTSGLVFSAAGRRRERLMNKLQAATVTDAVSGVCTRSVLANTVEELCRQKENFSLLVIDIDFFKTINDTAGHPAGDEALRMVGTVLRTHCKEGDVAARWGGDEFAVLLHGAAHDKALQWADSIRHDVSQHVVVASGTSIQLTLSIGVSTAWDDGDTPESLFNAADQAMYYAKRSGRNAACDSACGTADNSCAPSEATPC